MELFYSQIQNKTQKLFLSEHSNTNLKVFYLSSKVNIFTFEQSQSISFLFDWLLSSTGFLTVVFTQKGLTKILGNLLNPPVAEELWALSTLPNLSVLTASLITYF